MSLSGACFNTSLSKRASKLRHWNGKMYSDAASPLCDRAKLETYLTEQAGIGARSHQRFEAEMFVGEAGCHTAAGGAV
ncbi:hypothetical protein BH10ACI3_BH10ACI3_30120 [soil metagenome]